MEINVYKGEWGLASIDFECLRSLTCIKLCGAPVAINVTGNPFMSPNGFLPYLNHNNGKIAEYEQIIATLTRQGYDVNKNLTESEQGVSAGYVNYLFKNLHPYLQYTLWGDPKNIDDSRTLYATRTRFPFNFIYPNRYIKKAAEVIEVFANFSLEDKLENHNTAQIIIDAKKCINLMSEKLGNSQWFNGDKCSEIDGTLYAYLAILYHISLASNPLQAHIKECPNLVEFVNRITNGYFSNESFSSPTVKSSSTSTPVEDEFSVSKRKTQVLSLLAAIGAMTTYAIMAGILHITRREHDINEAFIEDDDDNDMGED